MLVAYQRGSSGFASSIGSWALFLAGRDLRAPRSRRRRIRRADALVAVWFFDSQNRDRCPVSPAECSSLLALEGLGARPRPAGLLHAATIGYLLAAQALVANAAHVRDDVLDAQVRAAVLPDQRRDAVAVVFGREPVIGGAEAHVGL